MLWFCRIKYLNNRNNAANSQKYAALATSKATVISAASTVIPTTVEEAGVTPDLIKDLLDPNNVSTATTTANSVQQGALSDAVNKAIPNTIKEADVTPELIKDLLDM